MMSTKNSVECCHLLHPTGCCERVFSSSRILILISYFIVIFLQFKSEELIACLIQDDALHWTGEVHTVTGIQRKRRLPFNNWVIPYVETWLFIKLCGWVHRFRPFLGFGDLFTAVLKYKEQYHCSWSKHHLGKNEQLVCGLNLQFKNNINIKFVFPTSSLESRFNYLVSISYLTSALHPLWISMHLITF